MVAIDYYFTLISPWAYLGHRALIDLAARHDAVVRFRPVILAEVFANAGAVPLAQRSQARQEYRFLELQRWRARRGLPLNLRPKHFPARPALADKTAIALAESGRDPGDYADAIFRACWTEDRDIADPSVLAEKLAAHGEDPDAILAAAGSEASERIYAQHTTDAVRLNAMGSPTYVLNGEIFWGQDRLDILEEALSTGRASYRVPA